MKVLQVSFRYNDKEVYTTQLETATDYYNIGYGQYANLKETVDAVDAVDADANITSPKFFEGTRFSKSFENRSPNSVFQRISDAVTQYLGNYYQPKIDAYLTFTLPKSDVHPDKNLLFRDEELFDKVVFDKFCDMLFLTENSKQKSSWVTVFKALRLHSMLLIHPSADFLVNCGEEWLRPVFDTMWFMLGSTNQLDALIKLSKSAMTPEKQRRWYQVVSTFELLARDNTLTPLGQTMAIQVWETLGQYQLLPWHNIDPIGLNNYLKKLKLEKKCSSECYTFDKYLNSNNTATNLNSINLLVNSSFLSYFARRFEPVQIPYKVPIILEFLESLPWNANLVLAGGSVVDTIKDCVFDNNGNTDNTGKGSDMDFFILGSSETDKKNTLKMILEKIQKYYGTQGIFYGLRGGVMTIWIRDSFTIQIIMSCYEKTKDLLDNFDLTCCQALWNGKTILSTLSFFKALAFQKGECKNATLRRVLKYNNKGWIIITDKTEATKVLYNRYSSPKFFEGTRFSKSFENRSETQNQEVQNLLNEIKYNQQVLLPKSADAALYIIQKRFPELTADFLVYNPYTITEAGYEGIIQDICNIICTSTTFSSYDKKDEDSDKEREKEKKKQINVGSFGEITWGHRIKLLNSMDMGPNLWYPRMNNKSISFRIDAVGQAFPSHNPEDKSLKNIVQFKRFDYSSSKHFDQESEFQIWCDEITKTSFLAMVNAVFNNFLASDEYDAILTKQKRKGMKAQTAKKNYNEMNFKYTTWPKKLMETGLINLKERKWDIAQLFYKARGLKKERIGYVGEQFAVSKPDLLKDRKPDLILSDDYLTAEKVFEDLGAYNVSLDLTLKVVLMSSDELIPSLSVNSITLYEL